MCDIEKEVDTDHRLIFNIEATKLLHTINFNCNFIKSDKKENKKYSADFIRWKNPY